MKIYGGILGRSPLTFADYPIYMATNPNVIGGKSYYENNVVRIFIEISINFCRNFQRLNFLRIAITWMLSENGARNLKQNML